MHHMHGNKMKKNRNSNNNNNNNNNSINNSTNKNSSNNNSNKTIKNHNRKYTVIQIIFILLLVICTIIVPLHLVIKVTNSEEEKTKIGDHSSVELNLFHRIRNNNNNRDDPIVGIPDSNNGSSRDKVKSWSRDKKKLPFVEKDDPSISNPNHTIKSLRHEVKIAPNTQHILENPQDIKSGAKKAKTTKSSSNKKNTPFQKKHDPNNKRNKTKHSIHELEQYSHLPMAHTPALIGAQKGKVQNCNEQVNDFVYWNDPQGIQDIDFQSPFTISTTPYLTKYVTFEFPTGGWNNIRMALEIIFIFAAATNRTIVLPPKQEIYLLKHTKKFLDFSNFFALDRFMHSTNTTTNKNNTSSNSKQNVIPIISAEEFVKRECHANGRFPLEEEKRALIESVSKVCENRKKSDNFCDILSQHVMKYARNPYWLSGSQCIVFDENAYHGRPITSSSHTRSQSFCLNREIQYYNASFDNTPIIHFATTALEYRLLDHFYLFFLFTNPKIHYHFHRFIRDQLHYNDLIYCAAGKIIHALQLEGNALGFRRTRSDGDSVGNDTKLRGTDVDSSDKPIGFSSLHIRRGDLQFKRVKIPAEEWYNNTRDIFLPNELLYIATDERDRSFFDPLARHYTIRFLDDYTKIINLDQIIEPAYHGMIDTIVASYGRQFVGTSYSTFTNYINRIRGYRGFSMGRSWYGTVDEKSDMHVWDDEIIRSTDPFTREFPNGWVRIDGDEFVVKKNY